MVKEVMTSFWLTLRPLLLLPILLQGNIVIERMVSSQIGLIAISALDYARFITETLLLLLAMPVAFSGLTHWSRLSPKELSESLKKVLSLLLIVSVPISIFLALNAHLLVSVVYQRGAFDQQSVQITSDILFGVAIGLWALVIGYVLIKALNAQMRNFSVLLLTASALIANSLFNIAIYPKLGGLTLGLGSSIYGLVLLVGTLSVLKLWRVFFSQVWLIVLGGSVYLAIDNFALQGFAYPGFENYLINHSSRLGFNEYLPLLKSAWLRLVGNVSFALVFWGLWILLLPPLRNLVIEIVMPGRRKLT